MPNYHFPNGMPIAMKVVFAMMMVNVIVLLGAGFWAESYAPHQPDATHPFAMRWRGGTVTFVPSCVGHYLSWGWWLHGAVLGGFLLVLWRYVKKGLAIRVQQGAAAWNKRP